MARFKYAQPTVLETSNFCDVFTGRSIRVDHLRGVRRGKISVFSKSSRKRFLLKMESYPDFLPTLFLTLTFEDFISDMKLAYDYLEEFCRRFCFSINYKVLFFWKKEFQKRGVVHFHLICNAPLDIKKRVYNQLVLSIWSSIIHAKKKASTNVELVKSRAGVIYYISLYQGKKTEQTEAPLDLLKNGFLGRWWGVINKNALPSVKIAKDIVNKELALKMERVLHDTLDTAGYDYKKQKYHSNFFIKPEYFSDFYLSLRGKYGL